MPAPLSHLPPLLAFCAPRHPPLVGYPQHFPFPAVLPRPLQLCASSHPPRRSCFLAIPFGFLPVLLATTFLPLVALHLLRNSLGSSCQPPFFSSRGPPFHLACFRSAFVSAPWLLCPPPFGGSLRSGSWPCLLAAPPFSMSFLHRACTSVLPAFGRCSLTLPL